MPQLSSVIEPSLSIRESHNNKAVDRRLVLEGAIFNVQTEKLWAAKAFLNVANLTEDTLDKNYLHI